VVQVKDAAELETALARLLTDSAPREQLGRKGAAVVRQNLGAIDRTVEMILQGVNDSGIYIAPKR
jgi:3-deoxy-D-manno-octulosonic-acid transferase